MRTGRPKAELVLSYEERSQLQSFVRSRSLPASLCSRARLVLASADGEPNNASAARLKVTKQTVGKWRTRFIERRIAGLYDDVRPGPARTIDDERVAHLIKTTLHTKPANGSTHWSVRTVAAETGISKTSVQRYFQLFGLQPHRSESFKLSNDPFFIESCATLWACTLARRATRWSFARREEPMPSAGANAADAAHGVRLCRGRHPRLQVPRQGDVVRGAEHAQRRGTGSVQATSSAPGVPVLPARDRPGRAGFAHVSAGQDTSASAEHQDSPGEEGSLSSADVLQLQ